MTCPLRVAAIPLHAHPVVLRPGAATSSSRSNLSAALTSTFLQLRAALVSIDVDTDRRLRGVIVTLSGTQLSIFRYRERRRGQGE
jgi:hypothetical protein